MNECIGYLYEIKILMIMSTVFACSKLSINKFMKITKPNNTFLKTQYDYIQMNGPVYFRLWRISCSKRLSI